MMRNPYFGQKFPPVVVITTALLFSACLFFPDDKNESGNPFLGQWKSTEVSVSTVRDTLYLSEFEAFLIERGYDFTNGYPEPPVEQTTIDSFNAVFSCTTTVCDSVLSVYESYLVFSRDTITNVRLENDEISSKTRSRYTFDSDSVYATRYDFIFDTLSWSETYRFSAKKDTLWLGEEFGGEPMVRNSDLVPD
jgi:hypothetical protein